MFFVSLDGLSPSSIFPTTCCSRDDEDTRILLFFLSPSLFDAFPPSSRYFFFSSTVFEPLNRTPASVSLSKSGEGNADDEWQSEEEMKVACRPGIYIFPRVTRLMIRLYAVARTRASRHFFQSGRRCWEMQQRFFYFLPLRSISREDEGGGIEEVRK